MQDLPQDDPNSGIHQPHDKLDDTSQASPKGWRAKIITAVWAVAVLVATAGWLYLITRAALLILNWLAG